MLINVTGMWHDYIYFGVELNPNHEDVIRKDGYHSQEFLAFSHLFRPSFAFSPRYLASFHANKNKDTKMISLIKSETPLYNNKPRFCSIPHTLLSSGYCGTLVHIRAPREFHAPDSDNPITLPPGETERFAEEVCEPRDITVMHCIS